MADSVIRGFFNQYRFLSNFYIEPDGTHVEGEYQRAKCALAHHRKKFHVGGNDLGGALLEPGLCKRIGRRVELRPDWEDVKVDIMLFYVLKKFKDHHSLRVQLELTKPHMLEEWNDWGDQFWGTTGPWGNPRGLNMLGAILIEVRDIHTCEK